MGDLTQPPPQEVDLLSQVLLSFTKIRDLLSIESTCDDLGLNISDDLRTIPWNTATIRITAYCLMEMKIRY